MTRERFKRRELALMCVYAGVCSLILLGGALFFMREALNTISSENHGATTASGELQVDCLNLGVSSVPMKLPFGDVITLDRINKYHPELIELTQNIKFTEILTHTARDELCDALAKLENDKMRRD
jgi:hypothetical protein